MTHKHNQQFLLYIGKGLLAGKSDDTTNPLLSGDHDDTDSIVKFRFKARVEIAKTKTSKRFGNDNISCYFLKPALPVSLL